MFFLGGRADDVMGLQVATGEKVAEYKVWGKGPDRPPLGRWGDSESVPDPVLTASERGHSPIRRPLLLVFLGWAWTLAHTLQPTRRPPSRKTPVPSLVLSPS